MGEQSLIERLKAATEGSRELDVAMAAACGWTNLDIDPIWSPVRTDVAGFPPGTAQTTPVPRYTTSLDAIVGLIARKLPGWHLMAEKHPYFCDAALWSNMDDPYWSAKAPTMPLALCIALLSALDGQKGSEAGDELARERSASGMNPNPYQQGGAEQ